MTDLEKIAYRQASQKFDMPSLPLGHVFNQDFIARQVVRSKQPHSEVASNLRNLSSNLAQVIAGISAAIEHLAVSASQIYENEQDLNNEIVQITSLSEEINENSAFIKEIAALAEELNNIVPKN